MIEPPLSNVRVLAIEQYGAGPFGTLYLAMMGAEVIKIENPADRGDVSRGIGPYFCGDSEETDSSLFFQGFNHNKKSIALDISTNEGKQIFHDLLTTSDAIYTNLRGDVPLKLGLTYEQLKEHNERLVCAHLTGYGRDNERASWPGYDYIMQAEAGYFHLTGEPNGPPTRFGLSVVDLMTGVTLSLGLVASLLQVARTGQGRDVDVSLFDVALYNLNYVAMWYMNAGFEQSQVSHSAHFALVPCQLFETADGWIYVMCNKEKFWRRLCELLDACDLLDDVRFEGFSARLKFRTELTQILGRIFKEKSTSDWMRTFGNSVPASPVLDVAEALENPFLRENGNIVDLMKDDASALRFLRNPLRFDNGVEVSAAPRLGEHTADLLVELGYNSERIAELRSDGVIL
jgi:crotonobetainyl-CoA:carnitine CoA-transferase CaiB-like acyl-CoA transferase